MMRTVALAALALALGVGTAVASPVGLGVGIYGGGSYPIVQQDAGPGNVFGFRVPVHAIPLITVEPYWLSGSMDPGDETINGIKYTRDGFDQKAFGVNAMLGSIGGTGFHFYPYAGIGSQKLTRAGTEIKDTAYNFGLGVGISPAHKVSLQIRGELNMVKTGDTSRKFANGTFGLSYELLP